MHGRFRAVAREVSELAYGLQEVCRLWQCDSAVVESVVEVVIPHGLGLHDRGLSGFGCVWTAGVSLNPVEPRVEGFPRGALSACEGGGLEEWLPSSWGVFRVYFLGVGLGRHEDSVSSVEDPPLGVRFEDVDGGMLGWHVQGVPRCDGYFYPGGVEVWAGPAA